MLTHFKISENTFMAVLAVAIGLLAGLGNYALRSLIELIHWGVIEQGSEALSISFDEWSWSRLLTPLFPICGGLLLLPFAYYFPKDMKAGFPSFLEKVNLRGAKLPARTIVTRGFASAITLGTGGSAGQEGPIAQLGGAIGSQFGQLFKMSGDRLKVLVACGAAAGVAATFNAPLAGVFFAQEIVLLASFEMTSFTAIVVSSAMATVVSRALIGDHGELAAPAFALNNPWELLLYLLLGLLIGALAAAFIDSHYRIKDYFSQLKVSPLLKPILGCALVGIIAIAFPQILGNGYEYIDSVIHGEGMWLLLAALVIVKAVATSITLGSGMPGGLFAPSLYLGAVAGGAFGKLAQLLFPGLSIVPGAYALVGMGAFLSAATHAPMTAIFMLMELTDSYEVIVPIMLSCVVGTAVSRHFKKDSLDTVELTRAGIDLEAGKERNIMASITVGQVMSRDPESIPESMTLRQFAEFIASTRHTNFPLVNAEGELSGIISVQDFLGVVFEQDLMDLVVVKELATVDVITVGASDNLDTAMQRIGYRNIEQLPVVDPQQNNRLVGIISRRDMVSAYNRELMSKSLGDHER
ncbi:MAG TPA: chloride channel protein [Malonomonas sp.]